MTMVVVPPGVVIEISLVPGMTMSLIVMLAVIWVELFTVKLLTVIPAPKLTALTPVKLLPVMITLNVSPGLPWVGSSEVMAGNANSG